ncbi:MAG: phosphatase PAP2 family protein [Ilumatobacteraceae bacterium]|nr:phosphatase PAP2 family protein [Ilumatobacter sp.]MCB0984488.1 phosphatase PAP2 family protein [Ilumatobacter sp.]
MKAFEPFDAWADAQLERLRGNPVADRVFTVASEVGDFSLVWHIAGAARGLLSDQRADQAFILSALLGVESLAVNQGIKRLFRRTRPTEAGDPRFPVRKPSTSAFPSGHASSGFFAATVLTGWGGAVTAPLWFGMAGVVATSRAYVRIHHPSDVVGGAVVGVALGLAARAALAAVGRA